MKKVERQKKSAGFDWGEEIEKGEVGCKRSLASAACMHVKYTTPARAHTHTREVTRAVI
jgi:hypothetical protein